MSWFGPRVSPEEEGREVAPGVRIERRSMLKASLGAVALLQGGLVSRALAQEKPDDEGELTWDALLKLAIPLAEKLVARKKPNEEAFLLKLSSYMARLSEVPEAKFGRGPVASASVHDKHQLVVVQFKLDAGAALPFHDHRDYVGILAAVSGEARVRSFDIQGEDPRPPKGKTFLIAETGDRLLAPGHYSHLSRRSDNVHDIRAGADGARLLDVFTFFKEDGKSVYLNVGEKPRDREKRLYEASWK
ncbi:hypothetical protein HY251_04280 [bacterium]|nr:hypothetical protein [bacterium]